MKKIKIEIQIDCWKDEMGNWRYTSDDLGIPNGFCSRSNQKLMRKINDVEKMSEDRLLYVHRCHWCGKPLFLRPTSLDIIEDVTILCSECLDCDTDGHVTINLLRFRRSPIFRDKMRKRGRKMKDERIVTEVKKINKEKEPFRLLFSDDINIHLYKEGDKWIFDLKEDISNMPKDFVDSTVNIFKTIGFGDVHISDNYLCVKLQSDTKEPAVVGELLGNSSFSKMTVMELFTLAALTKGVLQMEPVGARENFLKEIKTLREGKIDPDKALISGISGELKGSSEK